MPTVTSTADGSAIAYEAHGDGAPAVVLIHGWACDRTYWAGQLADLSRQGLVVAVDLSGHGESASTRTEWTIASFGADVSSVIVDLDIANVILVGHSMGADVALHAALHLAERIRGIVWVDQYGLLDDRLPDEQQVQNRLAPFRSDFKSATQDFVRHLFSPPADPLLVERVSRAMSSMPESVAIPALEATWNHARVVGSLLAELRVPVIAINSTRTHTDAASLARRGVDVMLMSEVGHFPMLEQPRQFNARLADALTDLRRRPHGEA